MSLLTAGTIRLGSRETLTLLKLGRVFHPTPHRVANTLASKQIFKASYDSSGDVLLEGQDNFSISKGIPK
jgi:hypothetical protein